MATPDRDDIRNLTRAGLRTAQARQNLWVACDLGADRFDGLQGLELSAGQPFNVQQPKALKCPSRSMKRPYDNHA